MAQVLLVENEPLLSRTAEELEGHGWNVLIAPNAASCMRVAAVAAREPFVVPDARLDPIVKSNPAVADYDAISYCGIPIMVRGEPIGTLCVIDSEPRPWSEAQVSMLQDLAGILSSYLELKAGVIPKG